MSKTVVLVDDSKFTLNQLKTFFEEKLNFRVVDMGYDGNDAVSLYQKHQPDLMTLDITMPNKNGEQAVREIIGEFPDARILIISAVRGDEMLDCMKSGAKGYMEKPLKMKDPEFVEDFEQSVMDAFVD